MSKHLGRDERPSTSASIKMHTLIQALYASGHSPQPRDPQNVTNRAWVGTNRDFWDESGAPAGTNPRREVPPPRALARPAPPSGQSSATRSASIAPSRNTTENTTGQSIVRCPAQREITSAASGSSQRTRRRRTSEEPPQARPARAMAHVEGSGTFKGVGSPLSSDLLFAWHPLHSLGLHRH
jgi:hypothetical protein